MDHEYSGADLCGLVKVNCGHLFPVSDGSWHSFNMEGLFYTPRLTDIPKGWLLAGEPLIKPLP